MRYFIVIVIFCFVPIGFAQNKATFNPKFYISIKPINYLILCPNIHFGVLLKATDSQSRNRYLDFGFNYPYQKVVTENAIFNDNMIQSKFRVYQTEIHYRILKKRSKKNKFWGPNAEFCYYKYNYETYNFSHDSYGFTNEEYMMLRIGFHNGRYFRKNNSKVVNSIYWGASLRYIVLNLKERYALPKSQDSPFGFKIYLNWQFGLTLRKK